jgi:hypothetical protein
MDGQTYAPLKALHSSMLVSFEEVRGTTFSSNVIRK